MTKQENATEMSLEPAARSVPLVAGDTPAMREVVRSPLALPGLSDGGAHTKFITNATYPTDYIVDYVRKNQVVDLEEAHWRLSSYSAQAAGLRDRGFLRENMPADIVVYDLAKLDARAHLFRLYDE